MTDYEAKHGTTLAYEREVVAESEDERTALAHLRRQPHRGPLCPICREEVRVYNEGKAQGHREARTSFLSGD